MEPSEGGEPRPMSLAPSEKLQAQWSEDMPAAFLCACVHSAHDWQVLTPQLGTSVPPVHLLEPGFKRKEERLKAAFSEQQRC